MDLKNYCGKDVSYFRNRPRPLYFADIDKKTFDKTVADRAANGDVTVVSRAYAFPNGRIDFLFDPTAKNPPWNPEWVWQLNRMNFWPHMALAYLKTGDEKYAIAFDRQVNDWIDASGKCPRGNCANTVWRTLECGLRLSSSWALAFEIFRKSPSVSDRTLERMIFSMADQAEYTYRNRAWGGNHLLMEMSGCCTFASFFPELPVSAKLWKDSKKSLEEACISQQLPDGMQYELSWDYQFCVFRAAVELYNLAACTGLGKTLSPKFIQSLKAYSESCLGMTTPSFTQPRTNDNCATLRASAILSHGARIFPDRKDFLWGATNGLKGTKPEGTSRQYPYAGFTIMRSGWEKDAVYLCFDHGPLGMAHQHQDKLNIQLYKGDEELIFDDGGGQYEDSVHRRYGVSAYDHNTVLVDGMAQFREEPKKADTPDRADFISNEMFDYAKGIYDQGFSFFISELKTEQSTEVWMPQNFRPDQIVRPASHQREILFIRPDYFCVADTLKSLDGQTHDYTFLLHMDTLNVKPDPVFPGAWRAKYGKKYDLLIVPLVKPDSAIVKSAQLKPYPSGWFVGRNAENLHPASTLELTVKGKTDAFFATLLIPIKGEEPLPKIKLMPDRNSVEVTFHGQRRVIQLKSSNGAISLANHSKSGISPF